MRLWNDVKVLVCAACCFGATACSDDGDTSAESNLLQPQGGAAGAGQTGGAGTSAGTSATAGGGANAGAAGAGGSTSVGAAGAGMAGSGMAGSGMAGSGMAGAGSEPPSTDEPMAVGFSDVATILQDNCGDCHGAPGGFLPAFAQDDEAAAYAVTLETSNNDDDLYSERIVVRAVVERTMPPGCFGDALGTGECLSEEDAALLEAWLEGGALP
jgi:hypothetical protein